MESADRRSEGADLVINPRQADADYEPFPSFGEWSKTNVDAARWEHYAARLPGEGTLTSDQLNRAQEVALRAAAVDTGAIEGLYEVDRGFTFTVAMQTAMWETTLNRKGPEVRALIESQLEAYDFVLDMATQATPVTEAWIRALHAHICAGQEFYVVQTEAGPQRQKLPHGEYKRLPNHVQRPDGKIHSYAPVDLTPAEMARLVSELHSDRFLAAHPVLQASYAHYGLVVIHPFADGNGRVARALASVFTYRSNSIPLLVLADTRADYISSLEAADMGNLQPFVDFVLERGIDALELVEQCLRTAESPRPSEALSAIKRLYTTRGGYSHAEVDKAGYSLFGAFIHEVEEQAQAYRVDGQLSIDIQSGTTSGGTSQYKATHRHPVTESGRYLSLILYTAEPARANVSLSLHLEVPRDADMDDDLIIRNQLTGEEAFTARLAECMPTLNAAVLIRLKIFVERLFGEALQTLAAEAATQLGRQGY